ncbi:Sulfotransferase [Pedobacter sp. BAL39]|uniref:sulfotransferase domain-containing protein n=1 Tax=Pedobacter sp. BAL39 TaxID=391596 RepID=UPI00015599C2|nr:sulfotransferase domain-containing protein [Pedobacter sp. BAL39]EDM37296.1 Sulfotransferase [Pedobacter sp. BAL39]
MTDLKTIPKKIIWLASYPKSGNTWFRAFLTALLGEGDLNINAMKTDGIFSSRRIFDSSADLNSTFLYDREVKNMLPDIYRCQARNFERDRLFIKVHDAYTLNANGAPIIPEEPSLCAVYFIRNPLDVACSFAGHNGGTIDEAIELMNNENGYLAKQPGNRNVNNQFAQLMLSWSGHVKSWNKNLPFPVLVLRYEDMLADTKAVFTRAVLFMKIDATEEQIDKAIAETKFEKLQQQEGKTGFAEKNRNSKQFFRKGISGDWVNELTPLQVKMIVDKHQEVMHRYGYLAVHAS